MEDKTNKPQKGTFDPLDFANATPKRKVDLTEDTVPSDDPVKTDKYWKDRAIHDDPLLTEMRYRMKEGWSYWWPTFQRADEDFRFAYEQQWTDEDLNDRNAERRPALTMNITAQQINHIVGQARRSKMSIHVASLGGVYEKMPLVHSTSGNLMTYAEVMEGLIREVEVRSNGPRLYARAMQHAVEGGFGWLQVCTVRPDDNPADMELKIRHVRDRWSVLFDPSAEEQLLEDAKWCCITSRMPRDQFMSKWPGVPMSVGPWSESAEYGVKFKDWWSGEEDIRVTDYYYKHAEDRVIVKLRHPEEGNILWDYEDHLDPFLDELRDMGYEVVSREERTVRNVKFLRATGEYVLEGPYDWPSSHLPIIPVFGRVVDGPSRTDYLSLTRFSSDAQKMFNVWVSATTERIAMSPKAQWLAEHDSLEGFEKEWANQHKTATPVLHYRQQSDVDNRPERIDPPQMPGAELALVELGKQLIMDVTGIHEAERGLKSNETSGAAIMKRREAGEIGSFEFVDNLAASVRQVGHVLCDLIARTYTDDRIRRIVLPDDTQAEIRLYHTITDEQTGKQHQLGLISLGRYMVTVEAGKETTSEREKFLEMMLEWGKNDPESMMLVRDKIMEMMDVPGAYGLSKRFKMMIPRHLLSPQEQENMPPPPPPDPETQAKQAESEAKIQTAQMEVQQEQLKLQQEMYQLEQTKIKTEHEAEMAGKEEKIKDIENKTKEMDLQEKKMDKSEKKEKDREAEVSKRVTEAMTPKKKPK